MAKRKKKKKSKERKLITRWKAPNSLIDTIAGELPYVVWCRKERDRLNKDGDNLCVIRRTIATGTEVCLAEKL